MNAVALTLSQLEHAVSDENWERFYVLQEYDKYITEENATQTEYIATVESRNKKLGLVVVSRELYDVTEKICGNVELKVYDYVEGDFDIPTRTVSVLQSDDSYNWNGDVIVDEVSDKWELNLVLADILTDAFLCFNLDALKKQCYSFSKMDAKCNILSFSLFS